jgi:hypothetical protein
MSYSSILVTRLCGVEVVSGKPDLVIDFGRPNQQGNEARYNEGIEGVL